MTAPSTFGVLTDDELAAFRAGFHDAPSHASWGATTVAQLLNAIAVRDEEIARLRAAFDRADQSVTETANRWDAADKRADAAEIRVAQLEAALREALAVADKARPDLGPTWSHWERVQNIARAALRGTP
jgi:multidrug resistance efflux pump